jgi:dTDP-glucose 4,6-dehydratase
MKIVVTGGAGFIGSHFAQLALHRWPEAEVLVLDKLTYAGNPANLAALEGERRFAFLRGDIADERDAQRALSGATWVINFAAESHVDRSIADGAAAVRTHVEGTRVLLEAVRSQRVERFVQVSTDEVYGSVLPPHRAAEDAPLAPSSPYSASKAAGDLLALAYHATYGVPVLVTRGCNTFGPRQFPEKLVPLFITNALDGHPLPVYGDGLQVRDWLHVADHCFAIAALLEQGKPGEIYNIAGGNERTNLEIAAAILALTGRDSSLLRHVADRPGHDPRYALEDGKLRALGWRPRIGPDRFEHVIAETVRWYRTNRAWWEPLKNGSYREWYQRQYADLRAKEVG